MKNNKDFWGLIDKLVEQSEIVIDRPKGTCHPKFKETIYEVDYGYLKGTFSMDGEGIDVFVGTQPNKRANAIACSVDMLYKDAEITILIACSDEEKQKISNYLNKYEPMKGIIVERQTD